ncbi:MAG: ectoine/hydroxyectoine ABC transporter permease subunit EhuC [Georgenia sp.]
MDNIDILIARLPDLGEGVLVTLQLTVGGGALAFVVAVVLGLAARSHRTAVRGTARVIIEFLRGTSLLVQLFWLFYVLPLFGLSLSSLVCGILALGLNYGAYGADVVRGAINSVPRGQWEATRALSMSPTHAMRTIVWPQAWAIMIPSLSNLLVMLLKGTAVAYVILMHDLTWVTERLRQATGDTYFSYGVGMLVYFLIALCLVLVANALEVRAKRRLGQARPRSARRTPRAAPTPAREMAR